MDLIPPQLNSDVFVKWRKLSPAKIKELCHYFQVLETKIRKVTIGRIILWSKWQTTYNTDYLIPGREKLKLGKIIGGPTLPI